MGRRKFRHVNVTFACYLDTRKAATAEQLWRDWDTNQNESTARVDHKGLSDIIKTVRNNRYGVHRHDAICNLATIPHQWSGYRPEREYGKVRMNTGDRLEQKTTKKGFETKTSFQHRALPRP